LYPFDEDFFEISKARNPISKHNNSNLKYFFLTATKVFFLPMER
jgi:hypothetical protein